MRKICKFCGKRLNNSAVFCSNECEKIYEKKVEHDSHRTKYFISGIIIGIAVMFSGVFAGSDTVIGLGIVCMGITIVLLPFTTPETITLFGYRRAKVTGRILGGFTIIVGIWLTYV